MKICDTCKYWEYECHCNPNDRANERLAGSTDDPDVQPTAVGQLSEAMALAETWRQEAIKNRDICVNRQKYPDAMQHRRYGDAFRDILSLLDRAFKGTSVTP